MSTNGVELRICTHIAMLWLWFIDKSLLHQTAFLELVMMTFTFIICSFSVFSSACCNEPA